MKQKTSNILVSILAFFGAALLYIGTYLHPMHADPNLPLLAITYTGFSELSMGLSMPASLLLIAWLLSLGVAYWKGPMSRSATGTVAGVRHNGIHASK